jgi:hypothetical protein
LVFGKDIADHGAQREPFGVDRIMNENRVAVVDHGGRDPTDRDQLFTDADLQCGRVDHGKNLG